MNFKSNVVSAGICSKDWMPEAKMKDMRKHLYGHTVWQYSLTLDHPASSKNGVNNFYCMHRGNSIGFLDCVTVRFYWKSIYSLYNSAVYRRHSHAEKWRRKNSNSAKLGRLIWSACKSQDPFKRNVDLSWTLTMFSRGSSVKVQNKIHSRDNPCLFPDRNGMKIFGKPNKTDC
jgi:hypothetical protein